MKRIRGNVNSDAFKKYGEGGRLLLCSSPLLFWTPEETGVYIYQEKKKTNTSPISRRKMLKATTKTLPNY